ncbi:MAG: hypothetical protein WA857_12635 [Candidatus Acidiferrum sp.]
MKKSSLADHLTQQEKRGAIEAALKGGMTPEEVFEAVLKNVYGVAQRKQLIIEWGEKMGLNASESLRRAHAANLIATSRMPSEPVSEKLPNKTRGKTSG